MTKRVKLRFPCDFTFKIIGKADEGFEGEVLRILNRHFPQLGEGAITQKLSKEGNYLAFTVRVHVGSEDQLNATYADLNASPVVLFAL